MMPGLGFAEMVLLALVAIVVIGPKDLPLMMRKFGRFTGKMRALAFEFQQGFDELGRQAELDELRREVADLKKHTGLAELDAEMNEDRRRLEQDLLEAMNPIGMSALDHEQPAQSPAEPTALAVAPSAPPGEKVA
jgi:sec-independent protein translocase protein TatB